MKTKKNSKKQGVGFGLQLDIQGGEGVLLVRVPNPRRLDAKVLTQVLIKYLRGGYKTLVLSMSRGVQKELDLRNFLSQLQATADESKFLHLETSIRRRTAAPGLFF
ncbi:hypothetical protein ABZ154_09200 [Streptomyces sp. NPDC006261]|uniref:hypothetical protein n=1 Tax=Streptomyces sp. NPDC006261 TaxID=3156739 RepID=UPI0033A18144